ncbi:hypothetical protein NM688_g6040 [Phlebia brevispora]|uniref:Uncharacterized protein n=1 Tax=Phlebia brevispora TaxID=194682 RepID=A0ACC1SKM4_9APHY|nr:hypothetical protein NM688_g6040 [Phlebia brevispora]
MSLPHHVLAESLVQITTEVQAVSYSEVASVTLLTWDIIVTMSDEVELIWNALLGINVDDSVGVHYTQAECKEWLAVQAAMLQLIVTVVDVILIIRVYALYNKNSKLLVVLSVLFAAEVAILSYVLARVTPRLVFNDNCFVTSSPPLFVAYWITSLIFETVLFILTLIKFVEAVSKGWGRRPVMRDFVSDGTWAYTLIFVRSLAAGRSVLHLVAIGFVIRGLATRSQPTAPHARAPHFSLPLRRN